MSDSEYDDTRHGLEERIDTLEAINTKLQAVVDAARGISPEWLAVNMPSLAHALAALPKEENDA